MPSLCENSSNFVTTATRVKACSVLLIGVLVCLQAALKLQRKCVQAYSGDCFFPASPQSTCSNWDAVSSHTLTSLTVNMGTSPQLHCYHGMSSSLSHHDQLLTMDTSHWSEILWNLFAHVCIGRQLIFKQTNRSWCTLPSINNRWSSLAPAVTDKMRLFERFPGWVL